MHGADRIRARWTRAFDATTTRPVEQTDRRTAGAIWRPRGRAVLGGLLVAVAAIVAFTTAASAGEGAGRTVVVAARAIPVGHRISDADLTTRTIALGDPGGLLTHGSVAIGAVAIGPIGEGEFVQRSAIAIDDGAGSAPEITIAADRDHALNGELRSGESIDVLATYGTGNDAVTVMIARDARVLRLEELRSNGMASSGRVLATLAVSTRDQVLDAVHASNVATITFVRTTSTDAGPASRTSTTGPLARAQVTR